MASQLIAFLDPQRESVYIYGDHGVEEFDFNDMKGLADFLKNRPVRYITGFSDTNVEAIVGLVSTILSQRKAQNNANTNEAAFIVMMKNAAMTFEKEGLVFNGLGSYRQIYGKMAKIISQSMAVRSALNNGTLRIVRESELKKILAKKDMMISRDKSKMKQQMDMLREKQKATMQKDLSALDLLDRMQSGGDTVAETMDLTQDILKGRGKGLSEEFAGVDGMDITSR